MARVFISYRRGDSAGHTGRLFDSLEDRFDSRAFFRDIDSISAGAEFHVTLDKALSECNAMLVMIGPEWISARDESGRRLEQEGDLVRIEVSTALARKDVRTYPVLVGGATLPRDSELPEDLKSLTRRNAIEISDTRWDYDIRRLGDTLAKDLGLEEASKRTATLTKWVIGIAIAVVLVVGWQILPRLTNEPVDTNVAEEPALAGNAADTGVVRIGANILRNLDKTTNQGEGFDYWPDGGIRIAYFHLRTFTSYAEIAKLSPVPVYLSGPHDSVSLNLEATTSFGHYNPEFLEWARIQVDGLLSDTKLVDSTRTLFHDYLSSTLRAYWDTIQVLREHPTEFRALVEDYRERIETDRLPPDYYYNAAWNGRDFFKSIRQLDEMHNINIVAPAIYFWVRREIGGTSATISELLGDVLLAFGVIRSSDVTDAQEIVDFEGVDMYDDRDSMRRIRERMDRETSEGQ